MSASRTGHQGLYPIIRRIRRPLLPEDPPTEIKPQVADAKNDVKPAESENPKDEKTDAIDSDR